MKIPGWEMHTGPHGVHKEWRLKGTAWNVSRSSYGEKMWVVYDGDSYMGEHRYVAGAKDIARGLYLLSTTKKE